MKYGLAIFDFDGTLADSFPFFIGVFNQLARQHGVREIAAEAVPGLRHYSARQMMQHVGLPKWKLPLVTRSFVALMRQSAAGIAPFPQTDVLLRQLDAAGIVLAVVTSNSHDNVARVLGPDTMRRIRHVDLRQGGPDPESAAQDRHRSRGGDLHRRPGHRHGGSAAGRRRLRRGGSIESMRQHAPDEEFTQIAAIGRIAA